ncbi:hypothetical protein GX51_00499 [Blastomyces parvus]|uniref:Uncharacterized protein n=1 Tax=Blastomyces parvus TaxID=2060905 RepID=A0A2B7XMD4_9EURO|nr:hypothetical protein GX51_00499 [Blastomyces parvus]
MSKKSQPLRDATKVEEEYPPPNFDRHKYLEKPSNDVRVCVNAAKSQYLSVVTNAGNKFVATVQYLHLELQKQKREDLGYFGEFSVKDFLNRVLKLRLNSDEAIKNEETYYDIRNGKISDKDGFQVKYEVTTVFWLFQLAKLHLEKRIKMDNWPKDRVLNEGYEDFRNEYDTYFLPDDDPEDIIKAALKWVESPDGKAGDTQSDDAAGTPSRASSTLSRGARALLQCSYAAGNPSPDPDALRTSAGTLVYLGDHLSDALGALSLGSNTMRSPARDPLPVSDRSATPRFDDDDEFIPSDDDQLTVIGSDLY